MGRFSLKKKENLFTLIILITIFAYLYIKHESSLNEKLSQGEPKIHIENPENQQPVQTETNSAGESEYQPQRYENRSDSLEENYENAEADTSHTTDDADASTPSAVRARAFPNVVKEIPPAKVEISREEAEKLMKETRRPSEEELRRTYNEKLEEARRQGLTIPPEIDSYEKMKKLMERQAAADAAAPASAGSAAPTK